MQLPISDILIRRLVTLGRIAVMNPDARVLVPMEDESYLWDALKKYISKSLDVDTYAHEKYDLIIRYRPLPVGQELEFLKVWYGHLRTNGRLLTSVLEESTHDSDLIQWLIEKEYFSEDLPEFGLAKVRGKLLVIDNLDNNFLIINKSTMAKASNSKAAAPSAEEKTPLLDSVVEVLEGPKAGSLAIVTGLSVPGRATIEYEDGTWAHMPFGMFKNSKKKFKKDAPQKETEQKPIAQAVHPPVLSLQLDQVKADPKQHRKHFNEEDLQELAESITKHGVLQPITVRPDRSGGNLYMIVFGERRWRASQIAGVDSIPAFVREMSDEEAFELQIIENLQRKDVHPMEEANAFRYLYDHGKTIVDIAGKVGKSPKYVAARLKLTDLIPEFQDAFMQDMMQYKDAKTICKQNDEVQKALFLDAAKFEEAETEEATTPFKSNNGIGQLLQSDDDDDYGFDDDDEDSDVEEDARREPLVIDMTGKQLRELNLWNLESRLSKHINSLDDAPFNTEDAALYPEMGKCSGCPHNSLNTPLLFVDGQYACNNSLCFSIKTKKTFQNRLQEYSTDPNMLFIYNSYGRPYGAEENNVKAAEELGLKVLMQHEVSFGATDPGPKPVWETYLQEAIEMYNSDLRADGEEITPPGEEEMEYWKSDFEDEVERWEYNKKEFEEWNAGDTLKAFVVAGRKVGEVLNVKLRPGKDNVESGASSEIAVQIATIREREERAEELDSEKVHANVKKTFKECEEYKTSDGDFLRSELIGLCIYLYTSSAADCGFLEEKLNIKYHDYNGKVLFEKLQTVPIETLQGYCNRLTRGLLMDRLRTDKDNPIRNGKAAALRLIAQDYIKEEVTKFDLEQEEKAAKRAKNVEKKIADLHKASTKQESVPDEVGA